MPQIKSNFSLKSKAPNFERDSFESLKEMRNVNPGHFDEGHISYCKETQKHYTFNKDNEYDYDTGYFRELTVSAEIPEIPDITDLEERMDITEENINKLEISNSNLQNSVDVIESDLNSLNTNYNKITSNINSLETQTNSNKSSISSINSEIDSLKDEDSNINKSLSDLSERVDQLEQDGGNGGNIDNSVIESINDEIDLLKNEDVNINKSLSDLSERVDQLDNIGDNESITDLINTVNDITDYIWPIKLSISGPSGLYRQGSLLENQTITWNLTKNNSPIAPTSVLLNGENQDISQHTYNLDPISSKNTEVYSNIITNTISVTYGENLVKNDSINIKFIYPKYWGVVKSDENFEDVIVNNRRELTLNDSVKQNLQINEEVFGKWYYLYPTELGKVTSIVDGNGFNQMNGISYKEVIVVDDITGAEIPYYIYYQDQDSDITNITIKIN